MNFTLLAISFHSSRFIAEVQNTDYTKPTTPTSSLPFPIFFLKLESVVAQYRQKRSLLDTSKMFGLDSKFQMLLVF